MAILTKGVDFTTGDQVTATNLDNLVDAATFASGAVDASTTQLSGGAIIVKDLGVTAAKLETATNGQLMIGNGTGFTKAALTAGTNIAVTNASGAVTLGLTGTVAAVNGGTGLSAAGTSGNILTSNGTTWTSGTLTNATGLPAAGVVGTAAILGANTFTAAQEWASGAAIASSATVNLNTATGNRVHITGTTAITAVTLTRGPRTVIFDGILTLTHNATTNNLPGATNITTAEGDRAIYESDGTTVYCVSYIKVSGAAVVAAAVGVGNHAVIVNAGNGHGSTNTNIRRFTNTQLSVGTAITYADSATLGATFTINETGLYAIYYTENASGSTAKFGASVNAAVATVVNNLSAATRLMMTRIAVVAMQNTVSGVAYLTAADVVRPHTDGAPDSTAADEGAFSIRKIGVV